MRSTVDFSLTEEQQAIRTAVRELCADYPDSYWRGLDANHEYPTAFVKALTEGGWLGCLIPEEYGGSGLKFTEASIILEEINRSGGNSATAHAQMYVMGTLLNHGSEEQKRRYLPGIASGELRLQAFGVTEPNAGSNTLRLETAAVRKGDKYFVNGQKVFISRVQYSDLMLLLARTSPYDEQARTAGLSVFIVDLRSAPAEQLTVRPLDLMINHHTTQLYFQDLEIPVENLIGEEGKGFRYIVDGMNAERILVASEAIGDGRWFTDRATRYTSDRVVFDKPIGANQGVQFPIAQAFAQIEAADLMRFKAAYLLDSGQRCGAEANMAKLLASQASWAAANAALDAHGGYGFAREFDVERKFRETRLFMTAPVNNNLVLAFVAEHVLGMPRSY